MNRRRTDSPLQPSNRLRPIAWLVPIGWATALWFAPGLPTAAEAEPEPAESRAADPGPADTIKSPDDTQAAVASAAPDTAPSMPLYVPPQRGAPVTRVGGGTRQADPPGTSGTPDIVLLSPEHTGLTAQGSPTLYWYLSQDHTGPFELVVTARDAVEPAFRQRLGSLPAGIHALSLASHGVTLEPGRRYQWSVSLVVDDQHRARDVVALAGIQRVAAPRRTGDVTSLAAAGLWYDAIEAVSSLEIPSRQGRAALLEQVGLADAAAWDRQAVRQAVQRTVQ